MVVVGYIWSLDIKRWISNVRFSRGFIEYGLWWINKNVGHQTQAPFFLANICPDDIYIYM